MSVRLQIIIGVVIVCMVSIIINMVRLKKIDLRYALSWLLLAVILLILDIFPQIVYELADMVGISVPSNMVFFLGFVLLVVVVYSLTVSVSRLSVKTKRLTQEIALLREKLESYEKIE